MASRPLITATNRDVVAGAHRESAAFERQGRDLTFVEGYSDRRQQIDDDLRRGRDPGTRLSYRLQYVTNQRPNGKPDGQKITQFLAMGYRPVQFDAPPEGIVVPTHAFRTGDGGVQVGDAQLFYCTAAVAAENEFQGRRAIDERTTDEATSHTLRSAGRELGGVGSDLVTSTTQQRADVTPS